MGTILVRAFSRVPRHVLVTASAWSSRVIIALVQLAVVRILIQSLGIENYAVFALLYGLSGWYLLTDFGLGFSVQNFISERRQKGGDDSDLVLLGSLFAIGVFAVEVLALFLVRNIAGEAFLRHFNLPQSDKGLLFFAAGVLLGGVGVGTVSYRIWYGQQKGYLSNLAPGIGALGGLCGTFFVSRMHVQHRLLWSLVAFVGPNCLAALTGLGVLLKQKWNVVIWNGFVTEDVRLLFHRAFQFWLFALLAAGVLQVDYIVIAQRLSSDQIVIYTIATRVFLFLGTIYQSALFSIWPVFTELTAAKDWRMVKQNLQMYVAGGTALVLLCTAILVAKMEVITRLLSPGHLVVIPPGLILLLGAYYLIRIWTDPFAIVLQSMSDLKPLWTIVPVQAALSILLEWHFAGKWGPHGVVLGLLASFLLTVSWWVPLHVVKHARSDRLESHAQGIYLQPEI